jgi:predicted nucleic acid-binding protein
MICLDANFLVGGVVETRPESSCLIQWRELGEVFCTPAPAWYEFLCGPVDSSQITVIRAFLEGGIIPFEEPHARTAARLFNAVERCRRLRVDAMIAATSIQQRARLATLNTTDFKLFVPHGLELATLP